MEGLITSFRRSQKKTSHRQMIVLVKGVDKKKAAALIGKKATWTAKGKKQTKIVGVVNAVHGGKGCVRVVFEKGMPGQSVGSKVKIE